MMQVFLHPGFHKTATSSAQKFLFENRELIWPRAALALPGRLEGVERAVFAHGLERDAASLAGISAAMRAFLGGLNLGPKRRMILSSENLLGRMPRGLTHAPYPDAPAVVQALLKGFDMFDWPVEVTLYFSTREQGGWVESLWAHHARKRLDPPFTEDLGAFRARLDRISMAEQLAAMRDALPGQRIVTQDIGAFGAMRFGAAQPFMDFLALPEPVMARFRAAERFNVSPAREVTEELLALNRSGLGPEALLAARRAVLERAGASSENEEDGE